MAKNILISLNAENKASPKINRVKKDVADLGKKVKTSSISQTKSLEDVTDTLDSLGNRFRYLSLVAGMASGAMTMMVSKFVKDAMALEQAQMKVGAFARVSGQSFEDANEVAKNFAREGIMSLTEAYNTLSNLLATGMNIDKAETLMKGAQDMALLAKESLTDTTGEAMEKFSSGIRIMQERMVDAVGVNFVAINVWKKYADAHNTTTDAMSNSEKQQAMVNYVMKEFAKVEGAATIAASTFSGTINKLRSNLGLASSEIGNTLLPVIWPLSEAFIKAANGAEKFAKENSELTMVAIAGSLAVTLLITSLATAGALLPMVAKGAQFTVGALKMLSITAVMTSLKFIALAAIIGTMVYLVARMTGVWKKYRDMLGGLQDRLAKLIKTQKAANDETTDPKVEKHLKKLRDQMALTTRSFNENMAKWVRKHDESTRKLKTQIQDLTTEYQKSVDKINSTFEDSQESENLSHRRRVEDLQRAIDEEISKGLWGDQTKIRNLKRQLTRENEDKDIADKKDKDRKETDLKDAKDKYDKRLTALQTELDAAEKLEKDHAADVMKWRNKPLLDYIDEQKRQYTERMAQLKEQMGEIKSNADKTKELNGGVGDSFGGVGDEIEKTTKKAKEFISNFKISIPELLSKITLIVAGIMGIKTAIMLVKKAYYSMMAVKIGLWFLGVETIATASLGRIGIKVSTLKAAMATMSMNIVVTGALLAIGLVLDALDKVNVALGNAGIAHQNMIDASLSSIKHLKKLRDEGKISEEEYSKRLKIIQTNVKNTTDEVVKLHTESAKSLELGSVIGKTLGYITPKKGIVTDIGTVLDHFLGFKEGGVVPGSPNQAVPIMAHGGETVIPAGQSPTTIVNINNPSVRNDNDIRQIANQVEQVLSRKTFLKQLT